MSRVCIEISLKDANLSDLHKTITCLLSQLMGSASEYTVFFSNNNTDLNIKSEIKRLAENKIKVINQKSPKSQVNFFMSSGDVVSRTYLYKAIIFIKENKSACVLPEYTFTRIRNTLAVASTNNKGRIFRKISGLVYVDKDDNSKVCADIIEGTCLLRKSYQKSFPDYLELYIKDSPSFTDPIFLPTKIKKSKLSTKETKSFVLRDFVPTIKKLFFKTRVSKLLLNTTKKPEPLNYELLPIYISEQARKELEALAEINYEYKGFMSMRFFDTRSYEDQNFNSLFPFFHKVISRLNHDHYDYIMTLPWIISGGADLFAINYLNTVAELLPNSHILAILTNDSRSSIPTENLPLKENIEVLNLPLIINNHEKYPDISQPILYSLLNILSPKYIHNIASKVSYDVLIEHGEDIRKNGAKLIFSSYNYLIGEYGDYIGYTVQELPDAYRPGDTITTDNQESIDLWVNHFGFLPKDVHFHYQLFDSFPPEPIMPTSHDGFRILWAAHIRPEKNPEILPNIAISLKNNVDIDCYGIFSANDWKTGRNPLDTGISNLHYKGAYQNFFKDIDLSSYDLFLYTSHADGTPNVILEAALTGLPIVSSSVGGIPNVLGDSGILVKDSCSVSEFVESINYALAHQPEMSKKALGRRKVLAKKYSKEIFIKQVEEMLKKEKHE